MYHLKLAARQCISCGICMDVCAPRAIALRPHAARRVEGPALAYPYVGSAAGLAAGSGVGPAVGAGHRAQRPAAPPGIFPYLAAPARCDGCAACVRQCPAAALTLEMSSESKL